MKQKTNRQNRLGEDDLLALGDIVHYKDRRCETVGRNNLPVWMTDYTVCVLKEYSPFLIDYVERPG